MAGSDGEMLSSNATYEVLGRELFNLYYQYQTILWTVVLTPIIVTCILSLVIHALLNITALYLVAYRYYYKLNGIAFTSKCWETARSKLAYFWDAQGRFWYGYEIEGFENIPSEGPALIVFYHGAISVDWFYFLSKTFIHKKRLIRSVGERFMFKVPAYDALIDCFQILPGTVDTCADILRKGNLLGIGPGGVREGLFGDETYPLVWGTRKGFAKVAVEAKVPIIPIFTENIREAFFTLNFGKKLLRYVYESTRIPLAPAFGGFPVKLKTFVGQPIEYDPDVSAEKMAEKVADRMKDLIKKHQQLPGSLSRSIFQRIKHLFKLKTS